MRAIHMLTPGEYPEPAIVSGDTVTIMGEGDLEKPFEIHVHTGVKGSGPGLHAHPWDEAFFIVEGEVEVIVGQPADLDLEHGITSIVVGAGSCVQIPANTVHGYTNQSKTMRLIGVVSDAKGGNFFRAIDKLRYPEDLDQVIETA